MRCLHLLLTVSTCFAAGWSSSLSASKPEPYDVLVYGGSPAGVTAAVQAARMGRTVLLVEPSRHLGGAVWEPAPLPHDDFPLVGGLAREFHERVASWYAGERHWRWARAVDYEWGPFVAPGAAPSTQQPVMARYEPHVAARLMEDLLREARVHVVAGKTLAVENPVTSGQGRILSIRLQGGAVHAARVYVDASPEGHLMAAAGVRSLPDAGETPPALEKDTEDKVPEKAEDMAGGEKSPAQAAQHAAPGGFVFCVTSNSGNRAPWPSPRGFEPSAYEAVVKLARKKKTADQLVQRLALPGDKALLSFSTELTALLPRWKEVAGPVSPLESRQQWLAHRQSALGILWTLAHHEEVPEKVREWFSMYGPCRDEWLSGGHLPPLPSVQESRRLVPVVKMTTEHLSGVATVEDSVGLGAGISGEVTGQKAGAGTKSEPHSFRPQPVGYRAMVPEGEACFNLIVPLCLGADPSVQPAIKQVTIQMILGQSAGTAAALCAEQGVPFAKLDYLTLRSRLLADGQVLEDDRARRDVEGRVFKERAAADAVTLEMERKTRDRARAREEAQKKRMNGEKVP